MSLSRRRFLQTTSAATLAAGLAAPRAARAADKAHDAVPVLSGPARGETRQGDMIFRPLGRTGEKVSLLGIGGAHVGRARGEDETTRIIRAAVDRGINFMDNCWDYGNGECEKRMGNALKDGYRAKVFLMTKIDGRTKKEAARQIDECLSRLQTDHIDLLQHHEVIRMEDGDTIFAENGANEAVVEAQKAGKVRFIGFTGHKDPVVHLRCLDVAAENGFHFDAAQLPVNLFDAHFRSFSSRVVPRLVKEGTGVLAMKTMGGGHLLKSKAVKVEDCLHYAMSLPVSTVIVGIDSMKFLDEACAALKTYKPLGEEGLAALLEKSKVAAGKGKFELYKTTNHFDGTAQNPKWLGFS